MYFTLYLPSSPTGELSRRGNFRPLCHSAVRKNEQRQGKWRSQGFLMNTTTPSAHVRTCAIDSPLALSPLLSICLCSAAGGLGDRGDSVTLTLEERVSSLLCCRAITANESNKCRMYNSEHPAFLHRTFSCQKY